MYQKLTQSGRSMVEMLGVLAIIGVLSITAIAGYNYAINKYRTNETIQDMQLRLTDVLRTKAGPAEKIEMEMGSVTKIGYPIEAKVSDTDVNYFSFELQNVPSAVCKQLVKSDWKLPIHLYVNTQKDPDSSVCDSAENVPMRFEFSKEFLQNGTPPEETEPETTDPCAGKPLIDKNGSCYACDASADISVKSAADCGACSNRTFYEANNYCSITCGTGIYAGKPLPVGTGQCLACDYNGGPIYFPAGYKGPCEEVCPNRTSAYGGCQLKPDACGVGSNVGKPLSGSTGIPTPGGPSCFACNDARDITVDDGKCTEVCPKRSMVGSTCVLTANACGMGTNAGKPLKDINGVCHACNELNPIPIKEFFGDCNNICPNRDVDLMDFGLCVLL